MIMVTYILGLITGALFILLIQEIISYPLRLSFIKKFLPWTKPAKVIQVDFQKKRKINN